MTNNYRIMLNVIDSKIHDYQNKYWLKEMDAGYLTSNRIKEVTSSMKNELGIPKISGVILSDSEYKLVKKEAFISWLNNVWIPKITTQRKYIPEERDCDNYAIKMMGDMVDIGNFSFWLIFGYCNWVSGYHAFNMLYCIDENENLELLFVEPQSGTLYSKSEFLSANFSLV